MKTKTLVWILVFLLPVLFTTAYSAPVSDAINLVLDGDYAADVSDAINLILGITSAPTDTCTYPGSGNWEVDCADNCVITTSVDIGSNDLIISGTGTFTVDSGGAIQAGGKNQRGTDSVNRCKVYTINGGVINSG